MQSIRTSRQAPSRAAIIALILASAALVGATFAAWLGHGPAMMMTLAANTLSWCF